MQESFLHYVWQLQYFDKQNLVTAEGDELTVRKPGHANSHAGPDFSEAKIKIGNIDWVGSVEVHIKSSDWNAHNHQADGAYDNVILHVVWQHDKPVLRSDGATIPTLELRQRVAPALLLSYRKLVESAQPIPCERMLPSVNEITRISMLEKALMQRLEKKAEAIAAQLQANKGDWEETTYQTLSRNFGFKVNADPFALLAKALPYKILLKHLNQPVQLEALLFGTAGLLQKEIPDDYFRLLQREYGLLAAKYDLKSVQLKATQWRFLRLRPANFPTLRVAQWVGVLGATANLFSRIKEATALNEVVRLFQAPQGLYWQQHYRFGKPAKAEVPALGEESIHNLIINSVVPLLVAYGQLHDDQPMVDKAVGWLQSIGPEKNRILQAWSACGWDVKNAFDSQGLIELHNAFCVPRLCLHCAIGTSLVKPASP